MSDTNNIAALAAKYQIRVPAEKLRDPRTAARIRLVAECLAVPEGAPKRRAAIAAIAERHGFHVGTAYRYLKRLADGKPLLGGYKSRSGCRFEDLGVTLYAWDPQAGRMAVEAIMGNRRNMVEKLALYNKVADAAEALGLAVGSYSSFCWLARKIETGRKSVATFRDKGVCGLRQDVVPAIRRDFTCYRPMECLVGDQHKADYFAIDTAGNVVTLELFCWLDFRTQLAWPSVAYKHYNRYTVGRALLQAVRWGLPSIVYTDLGKPEESNYMNLLVEQLTGLGVTAAGVERVRATGRHPQAKPIEGWFSWLDRALRNDEIPGYCKRLRDSRENELQQKELNRRIKTGNLLTVSALVDRITAVIDGWNAHAFKNRGPDTGKTPLQIYQEETTGHPVTTLADDVLEYIFLPVVTRKISRSQVRIRHDWFGPRSYYDRVLADYGGREAQVRYDPFDPACVWVFVDRKLVCQAAEWRTINPKATDEVAGRMAEQKRLIKQVREIYRNYQPPAKTVRMINPHEREARQLKTVRVLRTQLEKDEGRLAVAAGGGDQPSDRFRRLFSMDSRGQRTEVGGQRSFMRSTIDDPEEE